MFDKIVNQIKSHALVKKVCLFFAAFAVTLSVMGGAFGFQPNSGISAVGTVYAAEKEPKADETTAEETSSETKKAKKAKAEEEATAASETKKAKKAKAEEETTAASETKKAKKAKAEEEPVTSAEEKTKEDKAKKKSVKKAESETTDENEAAESGFVYSDAIPMSRELQEYTYQKCVERGIEYELVLAIIWRESRFNVNARSYNTNGTSDNGIMQINDVNKKWLYERHGIEDLMDPYQNIDAGTVMLGTLTEKYGAHGAMMAYQFGEAGMARRMKQGYTTSTAIEAAYLQRDYYKQLSLSV